MARKRVCSEDDNSSETDESEEVSFSSDASGDDREQKLKRAEKKSSKSGRRKEDKVGKSSKKKHRHDKRVSERRSSKSEKEHRRKKKHSNEKENSEESSEEEDQQQRKHEKKKRRLLREAKKFLKAHKKEVDSTPAETLVNASQQSEKISESHYYQKNLEFATWLKEFRGVFFSDLSAEETHSLFPLFVDAWNEGKLTTKYYMGLVSAPRTGHNWGIKQTGIQGRGVVEEEEDWELKRAKDKLERKKLRKEHDLVLDELLPKSTGKEAMVEKRIARREAARERDVSPDLMKEKDVMGGGDDFQTRLAREKALRERKANERDRNSHEKWSRLDQAEQATMDNFRALISSAGGKIIIPKRG